ncbi:MAG: response regulator transcription factor [Spirosomaceae bacterium]|jgi:DNA-binding NarL/FixJ family response regulator|nr:response regulator transcription factor [Spirosomataceae bacterium]
MHQTRIVILDDHEIFLKGLEKLLGNQPTLRLVATFSDGKSLLDTLSNLKADMLILDLQLPDISAEDLLQRIKAINPNIPILYLTMMRGSRIRHRIEKMGANGYILKDASVEELIKAINLVAGGKTYFLEDSETKEDEKNTVTFAQSRVHELLSKREIEILKLVCAEYSSAEIGEKLFLSTGTVDTHRRNILVKLGVNNTVGLVKFALQNGLIDEK